MDKLADFYQGETKRWYVTFAEDISTSELFFRMAKKRSQVAPDLEISATLDPPDGQGMVLRATFVISAAESEALDAVAYEAEHEIRSGTTVDIFLPQKIEVKQRVPKAN